MKQRPRTKHEKTFQELLDEEALRFKDEAAKIPPGTARDLLLQRASGQKPLRIWTGGSRPPDCSLSLSQTPSGWRLIENRAMLLLDVGFVQTDLWNGDRPAAVASSA